MVLFLKLKVYSLCVAYNIQSCFVMVKMAKGVSLCVSKRYQRFYYLSLTKC